MPISASRRPTLTIERAAGAPERCIAGVDEVGRGPLAGPVLAAAVVLPGGHDGDRLAGLVRDSKALAPRVRRTLSRDIHASAIVGLGAASVDEIFALNILQATFLAMRRAVQALPAKPDLALVDGNRIPPDLGCPGEPVPGGDAHCASIAAASIVAKVARDAIMADLAAHYPGYGWERNAGYPTREHRDALRRLGATAHHRSSFAPVAAVIAGRADPAPRG